MVSFWLYSRVLLSIQCDSLLSTPSDLMSYVSHDCNRGRASDGICYETGIFWSFFYRVFACTQTVVLGGVYIAPWSCDGEA